MAGAIALKSCSLKLKRKTGTLTSGADAVSTLTFTAVDQEASANALLNFSDAVGSLMSTPIIETTRVDTQLVYADE